MKIVKLFILASMISLIFGKSDSKKASLSYSNLKKDDVIENFTDNPIHGVAVTNDNYLLQHTAGFKNAEIMEKIPLHINNHLNPGIIESANTFITDKTYYDGRNNLNAIHVDCNILSTVPNKCVNNSGCGWCGQSNTCVPGNASGPLSPCLRNTFLYTSPTKEWNPLKGATINTVAINTRGEPLNHIVPEPNMNNVNVFKPYN